MLKFIRAYVKQMESLESYQSRSKTLSFYMSHFFQLVLRDKNLGISIVKHMINYGAFGAKT